MPRTYTEALQDFVPLNQQQEECKRVFESALKEAMSQCGDHLAPRDCRPWTERGRRCSDCPMWPFL